MTRTHQFLILGSLAALLAASPARAETTPEAQIVVERYVAACGGRAVIASQQTLHLKATLSAFGLTGKIEEWSARPDRRASFVALGPFALRDGSDGVRAWRTDPGGKLLMLDGKDLEDARASTWFELERWLDPEEGGGRIAVGEAAKDSAGEYDVLEITPPHGRMRSLWFDRRTGLHVRTISKGDDRTSISSLSDFRPVNGRPMAFRTVQETEGMALNRLTLTVDSVWVNVPVPDSVFVPPGEGGSAPTYLKTPGTARIAMRYSAKHVWLRASVNGGPPADFLYDTGASITVIDSAYAAKIALASEGKLQGQGAGSAGTGSFAKLESLRIADEHGDGIEMKNVQVAVLDLNTFLAPYFWREAAGVIGFDIINRFVNEIDFDQQTLVLRDPGEFKYEGQGASIPFTLSGHVPIAEFTLDGDVSGSFRIDVGSGSTVDLHAPFVEKNALDSRVTRTVEISGGGFGGSFTSRLARMKTMGIGPYSWSRPLVMLSGAKGGALASEDFAGNVGNGILERFRVTLDYDHRTMWLDPGPRYGDPDRFSRSGLQLAMREGRIVAGQVVAGSPAARAGIRSGDEVVSVNGRPPMEIGVDGMNTLMEESKVGTKVQFALVRDGKKMKKTIKLEDLL
jgi:hypothetical protein